MSSSFRSAPLPTAAPEVKRFSYREAVDVPSKGSGALANAALSGDGLTDSAAEQARREEGVLNLARQQGEAAAQAVFEAQLVIVRNSVLEALQDFAQQRAHYYKQVEAEIVQLALSIARKILHREAQVDPLLLAGIVRVALDQIESGTRVAVRVNPQQATECRDYFARHMEPRDLPEVVEDPQLEPDRCSLETSLGKTELGVEAQLKEIERGLMDLMAQRPPTTP